MMQKMYAVYLYSNFAQKSLDYKDKLSSIPTLQLNSILTVEYVCIDSHQLHTLIKNPPYNVTTIPSMLIKNGTRMEEYNQDVLFSFIDDLVNRFSSQGGERLVSDIQDMRYNNTFKKAQRGVQQQMDHKRTIISDSTPQDVIHEAVANHQGPKSFTEPKGSMAQQYATSSHSEVQSQKNLPIKEDNGLKKAASDMASQRRQQDEALKNNMGGR